MKKIYIVFLVLIQVLCWAETEAQIEYNFHRPDTLFGELPFDRPFTIKFTHIDTGKVGAIVVRIYETGITNYKTLVNSARNAIANPRKGRGSSVTAAIELTNDLLLSQSGTIVIKPDSIVKYRDFRDSTAYMHSGITLKPSAGYFIEISTHEKVPISKAEKEHFAREFRTNLQIKQFINSFAQEYISDAQKALDDVDEVSNELNALVAGIVENTDPGYEFTPVNIDTLLASLFIGLDNVRLKITDIDETIENDPATMTLLPGYQQTLFSLYKRLLEINWYNIKKGDAAYRSLRNHVASTKNAFSASAAVGTVDSAMVMLMKQVDDAIAHKERILTVMIDNVWIEHISKGGAISNTFPKEFLKQAGEFIRSDLGLAYVWGIGRVNPYIGAQISLSPVNDSIPLRQYRSLGDILRSRVSFLIGISVDGIAKDSVRKGLIGNHAVILGCGFKLWQWLKINSGFYLYYNQPRNPLHDSNRYSFKGSPFFSISIDVRVQALLDGIGNAIFKKQTP
jgi:hypothetical protein